MADKEIAKAKAVAKPRKPATPKPVVQAETEEANIQPAATPQAVAEPPVPEPIVANGAELAESIEAVTSPADQSDTNQAPVESIEPAPASEETNDMATAATHNEAAEKAQALFSDFSNRFKAAFEKSTKISEELVDFTKGNVEAVIASARVAAKAGEAFGQEAAEYGKKNLESATTAFKSFATVKSPTELFQLQSEYAKASFDSAVAEASRVSEAWLKIAGDIAQPISNRYAIAAEKIKSATL
jgi:phasin family protein